MLVPTTMHLFLGLIMRIYHIHVYIYVCICTYPQNLVLHKVLPHDWLTWFKTLVSLGLLVDR